MRPIANKEIIRSPRVIVMESLTTATPVVDICKKYGLSPNTFYPWREKFILGIVEATPVVDICKKYGLSPNTFYPWREKFIEAGKTAL